MQPVRHGKMAQQLRDIADRRVEPAKRPGDEADAQVLGKPYELKCGIVIEKPRQSNCVRQDRKQNQYNEWDSVILGEFGRI